MLNVRMKTMIVCICAPLFSVPVVLLGGSLDNLDAHFIKMAAKANLEEAHLGQMAEHQASQQGVKDFGQELSNDHATAYRELSALANKAGEKIPTALGEDKEIDRLMRFDGTQFDSAFLNEEVQAHKSVIAAFKDEAEHGENADLKAWAKNMIPTLEGHLETAERLVAQEKTGK
jgi:putative membrane protein